MAKPRDSGSGLSTSSSGVFERQGASALSTSSSGVFERKKRMSGPLDVAAATRALELLVEHNLYGSLVVSDGLADLCFFFTRGGLRVVSAGKPLPSVALRLASDGTLSQADLVKVQQAMRAAKPGSERKEEREHLLELARLEPTVVDAAIRELMTEVFLGSLFWENPQHEVATGEPNMEVMQRRDLQAMTLSLGVKELVAQVQTRIRTVTELRRTVASLDLVVEPQQKGRDAVSSGGKVGDGPQGQRRTRLLARVVQAPGARAVELAKQLDMSDLELASHLHELSVGGWVRLDRPPRDPAAELARLRAMEEAIDQALSQLLRRVRLAEDCKQAGDAAGAGRHLARAGGLLLSEGRDDEASQRFSAAVGLAPEDLEAREGFVQSLWATNRTAEAVNESERLGERYLALNLPGRARRVLERALAREERTSSLGLLVKSLVRLKQPKAAAEAGERLINRLRREGKAEEAREAAAELITVADDQARSRLLRAAGADRRKVAALLVAAAVQTAAYLPLSAHLAGAQAWAQETRALQGKLTLAAAPAQVAPILDEVEGALEARARAGEHATAEASALVAHMKPLRDDVKRLREVAPALPWEKAEDLVALRARLEAVRPATPHLANPLGRVLRAIRDHEAAGAAAQERLRDQQPGELAVRYAGTVRETFRGLPDLLARSFVRVQLVTTPPGASVRVGELAFSSRTPLVVGVPLRGEEALSLTLEGHEPWSGPIRFEDVREDGTLSFELAPAEEQAEPEPGPTTPTTTPTPPTRTETPEPGRATIVTTRQDPKPRAERPRIEFTDGWRDVADARFGFQDEPRQLEDLMELPARFRATVEAVNVAQGTNVYLVGFRIHLEVWGSGGWRSERPVAVDFERRQRPVTALGGGRYEVQALGRTLHTGEAWLREQAKGALELALRTVAIRERDRRR